MEAGAGQKTHSESQNYSQWKLGRKHTRRARTEVNGSWGWAKDTLGKPELKSMEAGAGQKTHSERHTRRARTEVNGSWAEDTLGKPELKSMEAGQKTHSESQN